MDYEFRKNLYELDEIGFIGIQGAKETEKVKKIISFLRQASKKIWKVENRGLTENERKLIINEAERAYYKDIRQRNKSRTFSKVASIVL